MTNCPHCGMDTTDLHWKPVPGFEHAYRVSSSGTIINLRTGGVSVVNTDRQGKARVQLKRSDGKWVSVYMKSLVWETFNGKTRRWIYCLDGDATNVAITNLTLTRPAGFKSCASKKPLKRKVKALNLDGEFALQGIWNDTLKGLHV